MTFTIYLHRNLKNQKVYIGQTTQTMMERWKEHVYDSRKKNLRYYFLHAIRKDGDECWEHEILENCLSQETADEAERKWIAHYKSTDRNLGYNLDSGGRRNKLPSPETRAKLSENSKRYWSNPENKLKQGRVQRESWNDDRRATLANIVKQRHKDGIYLANNWTGKTHKEDTKYLMRELAQQREAEKRGRKYYTDDEVWEMSQTMQGKEIAKIMGITTPNVFKRLQKIRAKKGITERKARISKKVDPSTIETQDKRTS